jgi:hypothetical protein
MSITEDYVKRAEECERLAAECQTDSNREIFLDIATRWRRMAANAGAGEGPAPPAKAMQGSDALDKADSVKGERSATGE